MDLKQLQRESRIWCQYNFPNSTPWMPLVGMMEELGELSHAHLKQEQEIRNSKFQEDKVDAVGDIVVFLADYCNKNGIDLDIAVENTWKEVVKRDWIEYPKNGVSE